MIAYFVTHDLKYMHINVVKKPYVDFIENIADNSFLAISLIALSKGGAKTLDKIRTTPAYRFNNWFDISENGSKRLILDFIESNDGKILDFEEYEGDTYYRIKEASLCPLCGNSHFHKEDELANVLQLCTSTTVQSPSLFGKYLNNEAIILC